MAENENKLQDISQIAPFRMIGYTFRFLSELFPSRPTFTEKDVPELNGKVYLVTGANTGVGKEVAQILYGKNAKVYVAARSEEKAANAIDAIKQAEPNSSGELHFLRLDLADLTTIKASADSFLRRESKLHVLFNNAGVMQPPAGSKTAQGYELQLGVNNIGTFMFTKLVTPALITAAKTEPVGSVRVAWVASSAAEMPFAPSGGVDMSNLDYHNDKFWLTKYAISKAGNVLHAVEYARQHKADNIVSVALNPGNLNSELWRMQVNVFRRFLQTFFLYDSIYGAYTEIFAGLSPAVNMEKTGAWIAPWGRFANLRKDLVDAGKTKEEGGSGRAREFWDWTEDQIKPFL
ncbi:Short-chain dehydrogenase/reductase [Paramyrothecium foliicola]|nr:Short-chain dehydrogenase/reductase [Paramyrothecium foliicola]